MPDPSLYQKMGTEWLITGKGSSRKNFLRRIANHENISGATLNHLSYRLNKYDLRSVAKNPKPPAPPLRQLADKGGYSIEVGLASNTNTPVDILNTLAKNENKYVRREVARNSNTTPAETLIRLGKDTARPAKRTGLSKDDFDTSGSKPGRWTISQPNKWPTRSSVPFC